MVGDATRTLGRPGWTLLLPHVLLGPPAVGADLVWDCLCFGLLHYVQLFSLSEGDVDLSQELSQLLDDPQHP